MRAGAAMATLGGFLSLAQYRTIGQAFRGEEGDWFMHKAIELADQVRAMPMTYQQDGLGDDAVVHLHYFLRGADWYITERDVDLDRAGQRQAFGLADLFGDGGELGYISIVDMIAAGAELDLHWTPRTLGEVKRERAHA